MHFSIREDSELEQKSMIVDGDDAEANCTPVRFTKINDLGSDFMSIHPSLGLVG